MSPRTTNTTGWVGWIYFAGFLMLVKAVFQGFLGIIALSRSDFYVVTPDQLSIYNYTAWGWGHIILAIVLLTAGLSLLSGHLWGRIVGAIAASIALVVNLAFLPAYPVWSILAAIIDVLILYAILVHGREAEVE